MTAPRLCLRRAPCLHLRDASTVSFRSDARGCTGGTLFGDSVVEKAGRQLHVPRCTSSAPIAAEIGNRKVKFQQHVTTYINMGRGSFNNFKTSVAKKFQCGANTSYGFANILVTFATLVRPLPLPIVAKFLCALINRYGFALMAPVSEHFRSPVPMPSSHSHPCPLSRTNPFR